MFLRCFGMRVWKFSRGNYLVTGLIISMAVAQFGKLLSVLRMFLVVLTNNFFGRLKPPLSFTHLELSTFAWLRQTKLRQSALQPYP
ncbi:hypothetical protein EDB87DRAFT_1653919 [Lactarius vividus]|nr:hypothetical protein EDB87DRAFT_1653919 [Lactarius vividus]